MASNFVPPPHDDLPIKVAETDLSSKVAEIAIRLGVLAVVLIWCFQIVQPFIIPLVWGIIIAVAIHPLYLKLRNLLGNQRVIAAILLITVLLALLMVPTVMLTNLLVQNVVTLAEQFLHGQFTIPPTPEAIRNWPLIGEPIAKMWDLASTNLIEALKLVQPQLRAAGVWLINAAASAGMGIIIFIAAFVIAGILLAYSESSYQLAHSISRRLVGERGDDFANLAEATIRSVARGVLGVAVIQALLAGLGFIFAGVPAAGIWALLCLILAVVQIGVGIIVVPAIIYVFATGDTLTAVIFLIWNVMIMLLDNVLKPLLLGRGVSVPMAVIFLGAIGGLLMSGIVGLFVGAIILALGYKLFQVWLNMGTLSSARSAPQSSSESSS
ncbi:AI-2E family transporter [Nitrosomonas communis]|uniref:Predicted PurR-regulated permease PerM n=1 Tax=Nitrosomonas communis TaxID=44574 RepID=A0A1H2TPR9_9PROT|nr:AI-2E family transporter [Nitrosomonas communis]SDW45890.1 Predicted PurR-regulated permease PerM [Nitrosomonas communis]